MKQFMFFIDFDGTVTREDVCATMVKRFAREGWQQLNRLWEEKAMGTEECARETLKLIDATPEQMEALFDQMQLAAGFLEFVAWAEELGFPIHILSDGYDRYIENIFSRAGIKLPYYSNRLEYDQEWKVRCDYQSGECQQCGVCKTDLLNKLVMPGYTAVYIGDGYSDICPAGQVKLVLAKKNLARLCGEQGISYYYYDNFYDVMKIVQSWFKPQQGV